MNPLAPGQTVRLSDRDRERLASRLMLMVAEVGCWEWCGATDNNGYGKTSFGDRVTVPAHRLAYAVWKLPDGAPMPPDIHHTCETRLCINPEHLRGTTHAENLRAVNWKDSGDYVCRNGHINPQLYIKGQRTPKCAICHKARQRGTDARRRREIQTRRRSSAA